MARDGSILSMDDFLFEDEEEGGVVLTDDEEETDTISEDDAAIHVSYLVEQAVSFMESEILPNWEVAEEFFDGDSDLELVEGRSQSTDTKVRDAVRALKPSFMRILMQNSSLVEYKARNPADFMAATIAAHQTHYVNALFWECGGYKALLDGIHNALLKKVGILKAYHQETFKPTYMRVTEVTDEQLDFIYNMPDVKVLDVEAINQIQNEQGELINIYNVELTHIKKEGQIKLECVPMYSFFVSDGATNEEDGEIIGERRSVTVSDAKSLGLEYENWEELDDLDPETDANQGESAVRRGFVKRGNEQEPKDDISRHKFLLTEAYAHFDLDGTGYSQLYRFWLGGTSYKLIEYERVEDIPYCAGQIDPMPSAFFGRSIFDILREDQNTGTSLLRATCDNAHLANNKRLAIHDTLVNRADVYNKKLGSPIRVRAPGMIQEIGVESTVGAMLPLLQYLGMRSNVKVGVTDAALGLDPDALQSTDKEAVQNTIQLAQGQTELMVRNFVETGVRAACDKLLKLSIQHKDAQQFVEIDGQPTQVNQMMFDPTLRIETCVGLGTGSPQMRLMALERIAAKQEEVIIKFGMNNPLCSIQQMFNTLVDMSRLMGVSNVARYFNPVTPEVAAQMDEIAKQQAEQQRQEPPSVGIVQAETIRAQASVERTKMEMQQKQEEANRQTRMKMVELIMNDDLTRDELVQKLELESSKLSGEQVNKRAVLEAQAEDRQIKAIDRLMAHGEQQEKLRQGHEQMQQRMAQQQQQPQQPRPQLPQSGM